VSSNFDKLKTKLAQRQGVKDPGGLAAFIGNQKFGQQRMEQAAQRGVPAAKVTPKR
jgi:hypothetical protein